MTISLIAAVARNGIIGRAGGMPWKVPGEMAHFKKTTMGYPLVMGRTTFESVGVLPGRKMVVLTSDPQWSARGVTVAHGVDDVLLLSQEKDIFVAGGAKVYEQFLPYADRLVLTDIPFDAEGDTSFPGWPIAKDPVWQQLSKEQHPGFTVRIYERTRPRTQVIRSPWAASGAQKKVGASCAIMRDGRLLLTRREDNGLWCLPGGGVEAGETWAQAAAREAAEETGLQVRIDSVLAVYADPDAVIVYADGRRNQVFGVCFRASTDDEAGLSDEVTQVGWFTRSETMRLPIVITHRPLVDAAFEPADTSTVFT